MNLLPTAALTCCLLAGPAAASQDRSASLLQAGEPLPSLTLPTIDGKSTIDLADLRGKKVLLIQFASW